MFRRFQNKFNRDRRRARRRGVPLQADNTVPPIGAIEWYEPVLAGPATFAADCSGEAALAGVMPIIEQLTSDDYLNYTIGFYRTGLKRFGSRWMSARTPWSA